MSLEGASADHRELLSPKFLGRVALPLVLFDLHHGGHADGDGVLMDARFTLHVAPELMHASIPDEDGGRYIFACDSTEIEQRCLRAGRAHLEGDVHATCDMQQMQQILFRGRRNLVASSVARSCRQSSSASTRARMHHLSKRCMHACMHACTGRSHAARTSRSAMPRWSSRSASAGGRRHGIASGGPARVKLATSRCSTDSHGSAHPHFERKICQHSRAHAIEPYFRDAAALNSTSHQRHVANHSPLFSSHLARLACGNLARVRHWPCHQQPSHPFEGHKEPMRSEMFNMSKEVVLLLLKPNLWS